MRTNTEAQTGPVETAKGKTQLRINSIIWKILQAESSKIVIRPATAVDRNRKLKICPSLLERRHSYTVTLHSNLLKYRDIFIFRLLSRKVNYELYPRWTFRVKYVIARSWVIFAREEPV